jgi:exodeoxyribonuclease V beta subunit
LLANSERELTNYLHIFEIMLEEVVKHRLSLGEIVALLDSYIADTALPTGTDPNIQRIESERSAVQIMTVHMSKGLEADVVFLFGGTGKFWDRNPVAVYHEGYERRLAVGKTAKDLAKNSLETEEDEENQRLIYVSLTRARAKLYLPFFPDGSTVRGLSGFYERLNARLSELLSKRDPERIRFFEVEKVSERASGSAGAKVDLTAQLSTWSPPDALLSDDHDGKPTSFFDGLRGGHAPFVTCSYTSLQQYQAAPTEIEPEDFKYDVETEADVADLPGGRSVGVFLHEVIEKLELATLAAAPDLDSWKALPEVGQLFAELMRRHGVWDQRWKDRGAEAVFNILRSRITLGAGVSIGPLCGLPSVREMEFVYPIPESNHPLLEFGSDDKWKVERGYLKGFVDFVFNHSGLTYFADWKSDLLPSYERPIIEAHVKQHYDLQARIYAVGVIRLLRIRNEEEYERRFGGLLYVFLRGMKAEGGEGGVYFHRPPWAEIARQEAALIDVIPRLGATR